MQTHSWSYPVMQWILVLMIFSNISTGLNVPQTMSITTVAGFTTHQSCEYTGEAWKKTKQDYDREYECLPADQK